MLMPRHACSAQRGFSLIELMVSVVLGLLLVAAVLSLVVSVTKTNAETIRSTRLTQELRTLLEVVSREVTRARYIEDPLANVGAGVAADMRMNIIDDGDSVGVDVDNDGIPVAGPGVTNPTETAAADAAANGCLRLAYFDPDPDRNPATNNPRIRTVVFASRDGALWVGVSNVATATTPVIPPACANANVRLSSPEVNIQRFVAEVRNDADRDADGELDPGNEDSLIQLEIEGAMVGDTSGLGIVRTVNERFRIGSSRVQN
jgi:prepilin-type N-terminal cleavage/methylation domain-containing protein